MNKAEKSRRKKTAEKAAGKAKPGKAARRSPGQRTQAIQESLLLALRHHARGRLPEAEGIYRRILRADPDQPVASHFLGVIARQKGDPETAVDLIARALAVKPDYAEAHGDLGLALQALGRLDEAVASYRNALAIEPDYPEAHGNLGVALQELGRLDDAVASYRAALAINPDYPEAHGNLGVALQELGRLDEAVASYRYALAIQPDYPDAHGNLGVALQDLGRLDEAVESYNDALAIDPDNAAMHHALGNALWKLERPDEALASYRRALDIDPGHPEARHLISSITGETTDIAPEEYVRNLFDDYAGRYDDHLTNALGYETPALMRRAVDSLPDSPETFPRALDLGCGTGLVADAFRDKAAEIDGVDLSPKMLEQAEAKGVYANLHLADVLEFLEGPGVRPSAYGLILSADTFVYIGRLDGIFTAARRAAADSGLFVFSVEHLEQGDFKLLPSGRYAQSDAYIETLAAGSGFAVVVREPAVVRIEKNSPIRGRIFVCRAVAA